MLRELHLLNRHQEHPCSLVYLAPTLHLYSVHCGLFIAQAGHDVERETWEQSLGVVLQLWSKSWNGRPTLQTPLWNALILTLSFVLHFLCPSCKVTCLGQAVTGEQRSERCVTGIMALKPEHNPPKEARISCSYSILPFILHDKCITCKVLETTYQKAKQESLWV